MDDDKLYKGIESTLHKINYKDFKNENIQYKHLDTDHSLINIVNNYQEYEGKNLLIEDNIIDDEFGPQFENSNSTIFSNYLIQTSFTKMNNLKRIINRKINFRLFNSLKVWNNKSKYFNGSLIQSLSHNFCNVNPIPNKDYLIKNKKIIETYIEDSVSVNSNYYDLPLQSPNNDCNLSYLNNYNNGSKKYLLARVCKNLFQSKLNFNFTILIEKIKFYLNSKKLANSSLSLLYLFTELTISKNKKQTNVEELKSRLNDCEKKLSKYEISLNEKAEIIASKNDRIEQQIETIELLTEEINRLNTKTEKLEKKCKNLNVINESLCSKCGNSLEESFISCRSPSKEMKNEYRNTIQEQLEVIIKLENENKDLKVKIIETKAKNEMIINDLEIIKLEFKQLSDNMEFSNNKNIRNMNFQDKDCQTDSELTLTKAKQSNTIVNSLKKSTKKFANKLNLNKNNTNSSNNNNSNEGKNITNYNIININTPTTSGSIKSLNCNSHNNSLHSINDPEQVQNLRFDNSVLTQEIINLNKELTKSKNELKNITETNKKLDKSYNDLQAKFKFKSENFDKIKKENEDLMILIQTSNYKSFISVENENKKLKNDSNTLLKDNEILKNETLIIDKKLKELEQDLDKSKKLSESLLKFKSERENLILENVKFDSEIKKLKFDIETANNLIERQNILIKRQEENINKMNEDLDYLSFNTKKSKQENQKSIEDIWAYQQIVRKLEKELSEEKMRRDKAETELSQLKQVKKISIHANK